MIIPAAYRTAMDRSQPELGSWRQAFILLLFGFPWMNVKGFVLIIVLQHSFVMLSVKEKEKTILSSFPRLRVKDTETIAGAAQSFWFLRVCSSASWALSPVIAAASLTVTKILTLRFHSQQINFSLNSEMSFIKPSSILVQTHRRIPSGFESSE
jgi:hypothetical protein